jgi:hypothetical protein
LSGQDATPLISDPPWTTEEPDLDDMSEDNGLSGDQFEIIVEKKREGLVDL